MPYVSGLTRTSVTLDKLQTRIWRKIQDAELVDREAVQMVLDDEVIPIENPQSDRFITVRYPSLIWANGDVMIGGGNNSELIVEGQVRITLWLRNELDIVGQARIAMNEAVAAPPRGSALIGKLCYLFWESDVIDEDGETAVTKEPMRFVSYEPPGPGNSPWRPFRMVFEVCFSWSLAAENAA